MNERSDFIKAVRSANPETILLSIVAYRFLGEASPLLPLMGDLLVYICELKREIAKLAK